MLAQRVLDVIGTEAGVLVAEPPDRGPGYWAGAPSVVADGDGFVLAYRLRRPVEAGRGIANVIAHSSDGVDFTTLATVLVAPFEAASLERPGLVRRPDGGWRLYVNCATPNSKHWWVEALDAETLEGLPQGRRTIVLPGDGESGWKDVVVIVEDGVWRMWACRHLLGDGDDEADRMQTWYGESEDGLYFPELRPALMPTPGTWDARGARLTSVWREGDEWQALYDGRASAEEDCHERTGWAAGIEPDALTARGGPAPDSVRSLRYVSVVAVDGGVRVYTEAESDDGSHELRTVFIAD